MSGKASKQSATANIMNRRSRCSALSAAALAAVLLCACGGSDSPPAPNPTPTPPSTQQIGPAGGTVTGPNGAQVVIPAGALAANTTIAIAPAPSILALPAGNATVGPVFSFTPHGQTFAQPVTITVPIVAAQVPAGAAIRLLKTSNGAAGPWQEVANATRSGDLITAQVTSFSDVTPTVSLTTPADQAVVAPAPATFTVSAIGGSPPYTYQWEKSDDGGVNFGPAPGATNSNTYTTGPTSVGADNGDRYRVTILSSDTDGNGVLDGAALSRVATLTVTTAVTAPTITTQPLSQTVAPGASATFSVVATGTDLVYQWQKNGTAIAGQTNASLALPNVQAADAGNYTVVVSNLVSGAPVNSVTSSVATLTVAGASGSLAIDAFEIAGPPARLPPPTQTGQFGSFTPAAAVTCQLSPTVANLLQFAAISAPGTQGGRFNLDYDTLTRQVRNVSYASNASIGGVEFRYLCAPNSAPQVRACAGVTVNEASKTITFVAVVLDFDFPSFVLPTPSDIRLNGTLNVPTCFP